MTAMYCHKSVMKAGRAPSGTDEDCGSWLQIVWHEARASLGWLI